MRSAGGCEVPADPFAEHAQPIFWSHAASIDVVALAAAAPAIADRSIQAWPRAQATHTDSEGRQVQFEGIPVQAWFIDDPPPGTPGAVVVPLDRDMPARLAAAETLWRGLNGGLARPRSITRQQRERLILGLRALDGRAAMASYRTLARGLFGAERVPDGPLWKTHDLRSRIMRLVRDAEALRDGGYLTLLKPKPLRR